MIKVTSELGDVPFGSFKVKMEDICSSPAESGGCQV